MTVFAILIFGPLGLILLYDAYRAWRYGLEATLSYWVLTNSPKYPIIPALVGFFIGLLFGHFWWDQLLTVIVQQSSQ